MIKNVVFDMGGVLIDFDPERTVRNNFPEKYRETVLNKVFKSTIWSDLDRGTKTSEDAIKELLPLLPEEIHGIVKPLMIDFYSEMPPLADACPLIAELKGNGYRTYLLSNATPVIYKHIDDIPALGMLDELFVSCDYLLLKPEREIYEKFFEVFSLKPEECFFIDDMPANIEGARAAGMAGTVFSDRDFKKLRRTLRDCGINVGL